jgi:hypothetical protein
MVMEQDFKYSILIAFILVFGQTAIGGNFRGTSTTNKP